MTYTKKSLVNGLKYQIGHSAEKAKRALLLVYENQTQTEQRNSATIEYNGIGFSSMDAEILSNIAVFLKEEGFVTSRQLLVIKRLMPKYAGQVLASSIKRGLIRQVSPRRWEILDREPKVCYNVNK